MSEREVILKVDDYEGVRVMTSFVAADLELAAEDIIDRYYDDATVTDGEMMSLVVTKLEELGYCKVIGPAPEIILLMGI